MSLGGLGGTLLVAQAGRTSRALLVRSTIAFGLAMAVMAAVPNIEAAFVAAFGLGAAANASVISAMSKVQSSAAHEYRGRVAALLMVVVMGSTPIGGPIIGAIADRFGARAGMAIGAVGCALGVWWVLRSDFDPQPPTGRSVAQ
ncbi:MAG: hypothetical protein R2705_24805 [Ilumatobacteraceae bacterium]